MATKLMILTKVQSSLAIIPALRVAMLTFLPLLATAGCGGPTDDVDEDNGASVEEALAAGAPTSATTGVPAGTTLRSITTAYPDRAAKGYSIDAKGTVTITKSGTATSPNVFEALDIRNGVKIRAAYVTIRKSKVSAGRASFNALSSVAEPTSQSHCNSIVSSVGGASRLPSVHIVDATGTSVSNFLIENSEIAMSRSSTDRGGPSVYVNDFMGRNTVISRVNMHGGVDGVGAADSGTGVTNLAVVDSYIHDLYKGRWSPGHGCDEPTHNDGIQTHGGSNIRIKRNSIVVKPWNSAQANAGIMAGKGSNILVEYNHFQYGVCSINVVSSLGSPVTIRYNTFYGNNGQAGTDPAANGNCAINSAYSYSLSSNKWSSGVLVKPGF